MTRLLHLIGSLERGGAEKQLFALAAALARRGWQQEVVAFSPGGVWLPRFREIGVPVTSVPRSVVKPWRLWRLQRLVRRQKPQLLLSWSAHAAVYGHWVFGAAPLARVVNVRFDLTVDIHYGTVRRKPGMLRRVLERADYVLSNSRRNLETLQAEGFRLPRAEAIYNIVAARNDPPSERPAGVARIVAVGSLIPRKALDVLLRAGAILAAADKRFEIVLAGSGPERAKLQSQAEDLGLADRVTFLGDVADVPRLLATAHVLAHPSRNEGLSNAILEAMAEGVPVVACPVGAAPEIIEDGRNGLLVPVGEPQAMAAALGRLLDDAELRTRLGRNAWEQVCRHFDEATISGQYENVFRRLIGANG